MKKQEAGSKEQGARRPIYNLEEARSQLPDASRQKQDLQFCPQPDNNDNNDNHANNYNNDNNSSSC